MHQLRRCRRHHRASLARAALSSLILPSLGARRPALSYVVVAAVFLVVQSRGLPSADELYSELKNRSS